MFDLHGRVALVSGAGQGVGATIASTLAAHGAAVVVNDLSANRSSATAAAITAAGGRAVAAVADVADWDSVTAALAGAAGLGAIDILVNNAGIPPTGLSTGPFAESDRHTWSPSIDVNLYGVLHLTRATLGPMLAQGWGRIVTIVSDAGRIGERDVAVYAASKAAAIGFSRSLAKETGAAGVTCNCVSLATMQRGEQPTEAERRQARRYAIPRLGRPDDVAPAVLWLVSDEAAWVTGQTIPVNGGYAT